MNDTTPEMQELHRRLLMERSGEERVRMCFSMNQSARAIVWSTLPEDLSATERRVRFFLRLYGNDFSEEEKENIIARIRDYDAGL